MSVTFAKDAVSLKIQNPDLGDLLAVRKQQAAARRSDGAFYRYALATGETHEREIGWSELRRWERDDLLGFFEDTAAGVLNDFIFTDERGTAWDAHFLNTNLEFITVHDDEASSSTFNNSDTSDESDYPTTTRSGGVYSVTVRLRLW